MVPTARHVRRGAAAALTGLLVIAPVGAARPMPPCPADVEPVVPAFGPVGGPPAVAIWHDVALDLSSGCPVASGVRVPFAVALSARFRHAGSVEDLARRFGAVSATRGAKYWSTTDGAWRTLISDAFAVRTAETDAARSDFSAQEVASGRPLHFAQDDTRSSGRNLYRMTTLAVTPDRLVVEIVNLSPIRLWLVTLFDPEALVSVHSVYRLAPGIWGYYGLNAVRSAPGGGGEKSFVNRAAAFYRFLAGVPGDRDPPLAP